MLDRYMWVRETFVTGVFDIDQRRVVRCCHLHERPQLQLGRVRLDLLALPNHRAVANCGGWSAAEHAATAIAHLLVAIGVKSSDIDVVELDRTHK